ncbi:hypothetical protein [Tenacibaculum discolor]|uniref:hypothetical protein n=1 Tax=Tenacibaculum discolor TaxID=361581 RepID=UPI000F599B54|nr:hypothetical protein [Tenacibaculum discolor]
MKKTFQLLILCLFLSFTSCKTLIKIINRYYPPLSTTDQQIISIEQNLALIDSINPNVGVHINKHVLDEYLPIEIKKLAENASDKTIEIRKFEPKLYFEKQAIQIKADFVFYLSEYEVSIQGKLLGFSSLSTNRDSLYVRNAFKTLSIKKIEFKNKPTLKEIVLAKLIKPIFDDFITNINGEMLKKPSVIYLGWKEALKFDPKNIFKGQTTQVTSSNQIINRYLKHSLILVDEEGISIILEISDKKEPYNVDKVTNSTNTIGVNKLFKKYKNEFKIIWNSSFEELNRNTEISLSINKSVLSSIFNEAFSKNFQVSSKLKNKKAKFSSKVEVEKSKINCQKVREPFKYKRYKRDKCDWSCMKTVTVGICPLCKKVKVEDPVCVTTRTACNAREEAKVAADNLKYETERAAHNVIQESKVAACNVVREANNFLALGKLSGHTSGTGEVNIDFNRFHFSNDLSSLDISYSGKVNYKLNSKLNIQPMDLGYVFLCQLNYSKSTSSKISAELKQQTTALKLTTKKEDDNLIITTKIEPVKFKAIINPSPLHEMFKDPKFFGSCSVFYGFLGWASGTAAIANVFDFIKLSPEAELMLMGKVNGQHQLDKIETKIKPIKFKINSGTDMKADIYWRAKSIDFIHIRE